MAATFSTVLAKGILTTKRLHTVQNVALIWIDGKIDQSSNDFYNTMQSLRAVINDVNFFRHIKECVEFLKQIEHEKALVITSGSLGSNLVEQIHGIKQVHTIYVYCSDVAWHRQWTKNWSKIKDAYSDIRPLCKALKEAVKQSNEDSIGIHFVPAVIHEGKSDTETNRLEATFMYTKIFKYILLDMEHDQRAFHYYAEYCRKPYKDNESALKIIHEFDQNYQPDLAVWWYTKECFIYQMLNRALRLFEADIIVNMGFFIRDLHFQLEKLHKEQCQQFGDKPLILYRGQGLSVEDFEQVKKNRNGLMSFNNFLSTSRSRKVAMKFADHALGKGNTIAVLFVMTIDPTLNSIVFADIQNASDVDYGEQEILFAMNTVFRIGAVKMLDTDNGHHEVNITLSSDDDPRFRQITNRIESELDDSMGWPRLGRMLIFVGELSKAEELYVLLLEKATTEKEKAEYLDRLGLIKDEQGDYKKSLELYQQSADIPKTIFSPMNPLIAATLNNIGTLHVHMKDYRNAASFFRKALIIYEKEQPSSLSALAYTYNEIGSIYAIGNKNEEALKYYNSALIMEEQIFDENDPSLAVSYNNIGLVHVSMGDYTQAISYYQKALKVEEISLAPNSLTRVTTYTNIGTAYHHIGQYKEALFYLEKASTILQRTLPSTHKNTLAVIESIDIVKKAMESS